MSDIESITSIIQQLDASVNFWNNLRYVFVGATAFFTVLSFLTFWMSGNKAVSLSKAKDQLARLKDDESKKEVAALNSKAESAITKQKEFEHQNLTLRNDLNKTGTELANAQRALLEVQGRLTARHITNEQRRRLIDLLTNSPKGQIHAICTNASDKETIAFFEQIVEVLVDAGWSVEKSIIGKLISIGGGSSEGITIAIRTQQSPSNIRAGALQQAFAQVGISVSGILKNNLSDDQVEMAVGAKTLLSN